jgi:hypothetical protein
LLEQKFTAGAGFLQRKTKRPNVRLNPVLNRLPPWFSVGYKRMVQRDHHTASRQRGLQDF